MSRRLAATTCAALALAVTAALSHAGQAISRPVTLVLPASEPEQAISRAWSVSLMAAAPVQALARPVTVNASPSEPNQAFSRAQTLGEPCVGDSDRSTNVDFADVTSVLAHWLTDYEGTSGPGDANFDGFVDFSDLTAVLGSWLQSCQ